MGKFSNTNIKEGMKYCMNYIRSASRHCKMNHFRISFASTVGYTLFHLLQGLQKSGNLSWKLSIVINWTTWQLMVIIWKLLFLKIIATT